MVNGLTARQSLFVATYLNVGNAIEAYRAAGYSMRGTSVNVRASKLLANPAIRSEIERLQAARMNAAAASVKRDIRWVEDRHADIAERARAVGDLTNETRNIEGIGRIHGAYSDSVAVSLGQAEQYDAIKLQAARELAAAIMRGRVEAAVIGAPESEPKALPIPDASAHSTPIARTVHSTTEVLIDTELTTSDSLIDSQKVGEKAGLPPDPAGMVGAIIDSGI